MLVSETVEDVHYDVLCIVVVRLKDILSSLCKRAKGAETTLLYKTDIVLELLNYGGVNVLELVLQVLALTVLKEVGQTSQSVRNNSWNWIFKVW